MILYGLHHFVESERLAVGKDRGRRGERHRLQTHGLHAAQAWNDGYDFWAEPSSGFQDRGFSELDVRIDSGDGIVRDVLGNDDAVRLFRG